jgi:hypothetical protein
MAARSPGLCYFVSRHDVGLLGKSRPFVTTLADPTQTWSGTLRSTINTSPVRIESLLICPSRNRLIAAGFISQRAAGTRLPSASRTPDQKPPTINGHEPPNLMTDSEFELMQRSLVIYDLNRPGLEKGYVSRLQSFRC